MPIIPAPEEILTIEPPPELGSSAISCFIDRKTPLRLTAMSRFQCSSVVSSSGVGGCSIPALLIALSRRPKPSMVAVTARARSPEFATLQTTGLCATPSSFYQSGGFSQAFFVDGSEGDIG